MTNKLFDTSVTLAPARGKILNGICLTILFILITGNTTAQENELKGIFFKVDHSQKQFKCFPFQTIEFGKSNWFYAEFFADTVVVKTHDYLDGDILLKDIPFDCDCLKRHGNGLILKYEFNAQSLELTILCEDKRKIMYKGKVSKKNKN